MEFLGNKMFYIIRLEGRYYIHYLVYNILRKHSVTEYENKQIA